MKKLLCLLMCCTALPAMAEDADGGQWNLNLREISLSYSNTSVGNAEEYRNSPISQFTQMSSLR